MISMQNNLKPGYSFVELMFGILIIAVLITFVGPRMIGLLTKSKKVSTQNTLKIVSAALEHYNGDVGHYPEDIKYLVIKPEGANGWDGPYVGKGANPEVPNDAWGQPLKYEKSLRGVKPPFKLWSEGDPNKEDDRIDA